jgi:hypothetical protein
MKTFLVTVGIALVLGGCASTATQMAWGKAGVSKVEYGTDVGMCTGLAVAKHAGNGANTAGGISGQNNTNGTDKMSAIGTNSANVANATAGQSTGSAGSQPATPIGGGSYSGMASADFAQRAATQQRTAEMAAQRARAAALRSCLVERGYQEFALSAEQAEHLATLKKGSSEYHEYLYKLGSDAEVVGKQRRPPAK